MMWSRTLPLSLIFILFSVFWYINYLVPLHSDDFAYKLLGLDIEQHITQYKNWSGRLVADYISPILLSIDNKPAASLLQTIGLFSLVGAISLVPNSKQKPWIFLTIFSLYCISSPDFGQINLWIVGSANYMWTALLYVSYLLLLIRFLETHRIPWYAYPLALLAGCTNESAAVIVCLFSVAVLAWHVACARRLSLQLAAYVALFIVGAIVLISAPGNDLRLASPVFDDWNNLSLPGKIRYHLENRFFLVFTKSWVAYAACLLAMAAGLVLRKSPFLADGRPSHLAFSFVFFMLAIAANMVMLFSPVFPPRAMGVSFVFVLISLSFALASICTDADQPGSYAWLRITGSLGFIASLLLAILILPAYQSFSKQSRHVERLIMESRHKDSIDIPDFYFGWLPGSRYGIDPYVNTQRRSQYYGLEQANRVHYDFDYSALDEPAHGHVRHEDDQTAYKYYLYKEKFGFITGFIIDVSEEARDIVFEKVLIEYDDGSEEEVSLLRFYSTESGDYISFRAATFPLREVKRLTIQSIPSSEIDASLTARGMRKISDGHPFEVYLGQGNLFYVSRTCSEADRNMTFFLHVSPVQAKDLPNDRRDHGFDNLDFSFQNGGYFRDNFCVIQRLLPSYPIRKFDTGQFNQHGRVWSIRIEPLRN